MILKIAGTIDPVKIERIKTLRLERDGNIISVMDEQGVYLVQFRVDVSNKLVFNRNSFIPETAGILTHDGKIIEVPEP